MMYLPPPPSPPNSTSFRTDGGYTRLKMANEICTGWHQFKACESIQPKHGKRVQQPLGFLGVPWGGISQLDTPFDPRKWYIFNIIRSHGIRFAYPSTESPRSNRATGILLALLAMVLVPGTALSQGCGPVTGNNNGVSLSLAEDSSMNIIVNNNSLNNQINIVPPNATIGIDASHGGPGDILIDLTDTTIITDEVGVTPTGDSDGIKSTHSGTGGNIEIEFTSGCIEIKDEYDAHESNPDRAPKGILGYHTGTGNVDITVSDSRIYTQAIRSYGILGHHADVGDIELSFSGGAIETGGERGYGIYGRHEGRGKISIDFSGGTITTTGERAHGIYGGQLTSTSTGDMELSFSSGTIDTDGDYAYGIYGIHFGTGNVDMDFSGGTIDTDGDHAYGIIGWHFGGTGNVGVDFSGGTIDTTGDHAHGIYGIHYTSTGTSMGDMELSFSGGNIATSGSDAYGIIGYHSGTGNIGMDFSGGTIDTGGEYAYGIRGQHNGTGNVGIDFSGGTIDTTGDNASGIRGHHAGTGNVGVDFSGGTITTRGQSAHGIFIQHAGTGNVGIMTGVGTSIIAKGEGAHGISTVGGIKNTIRIFGEVKGGSRLNGVSAAGLYIEGEGMVTIGHQASVGSDDYSVDSVAIRANGILLVNLLPADDKPWHPLKGTFEVDNKDDTSLSANTVMLLEDGEFKDVWAPSGFHEVQLDPDFMHGDMSFDFSTKEAWRVRYGIIRGVYEALPGAIRRIHTVPCSLSTRQSSVEVCGGRGKFTPKRSDSGMRYSYDSNAIQAHIARPLSDRMTGWIGGRLVNGEVKVKTAGAQGLLKIKGPGIYGGVHLEMDNDNYLQAKFSLSRYDAEISSVSNVEGAAAGAKGTAYSLGLETGREFVLANGTRLIGHGWYHQAGASVDPFHPRRNTFVVSGRDRQSRVGLGLKAGRTMELSGDGHHLELSGDVGLEHVLDQDSHATGSGTRVGNTARENRLLVGVGADYHRGDDVVINGDVFLHGLASDDIVYGLRVGANFSF